jgi:hypothetical protein
MNATKTLSFTAAEYHMLSLAARGEGKKPEEFLASILTRFFRAMADLQGIECPVTVTPEHIHRPGLTRQPAEESTAVLNVPAAPAGLPAVKKLPLPQPPSLTARGEIQDAAAIDWTNPNLYK